MARRLFDATPAFHIGRGKKVRVYLSNGRTLADITTVGGDAIPNAELTTAADGSVPAFKGPADGTSALLVQSVGRISDRVTVASLAADVLAAPAAYQPTWTYVSASSARTSAVGEFTKADTSAAGWTLTLPTSPADGARVGVKKVSTDTNLLTIAAAGGGTIDGTPTRTTLTPWAGEVYEHQGANVWLEVGSMSTTGPAGRDGIDGTNGTNGAISAVQDEGVTLPVRSKLNLIGASVTATDDSANDRTNITVAASSAVVGALPRKHVSGRYYSTPGAVASLTMASGYKYCFPFEVYESTSFVGMGLNIQALQAGSVIRCGVYNDSNGLPGTLNFEATATTQIDGGTTGNHEVTISQTLAAGVYWLAARSTGNDATPYAIQYLAAMIGSTTIAGMMQNSVSGYNDAGGGSGALDAAWGSTYQATLAVPKLTLHVA